jgi:glucose/arabinose dehydrogenase
MPDTPSKHGTKQIDGLAFLPDGRLVVCQPSGEIFFYDIAKKEWHLYADGLHNPLGLIAVSPSEIIVCQRPELTAVKDTDGDGKADFFEVLSDDFGMSGNYHEFNFTPTLHPSGDIYFALGTGSSGNGIRAIVRGKFDPRGRPGRMHGSTPYRGWVLKVTKDGETVPVSSGHRTPNGVGIDLDGNVFVTDNQGDWIGTSKMFHVKPGRFFGHATSLTWREGFTQTPLAVGAEGLDKLRTRAAICFPHGSMANSPTKILPDDTKGKFGPFAGQLFVGEMNKARIMRVMIEEVDGELQGAVVPFVDGAGLRTGNNRFDFAPDGSLWVGHTKHTWAGNEGIQRIVWDGKTPFDVYTMKLTKNGFRFTFTKPVNKAIAAKPETWPFKRYYYQYHEKYGSKQYDLKPVAVSNVKVSDDGKVVDVALTEVKAWHIHEVNINGLMAQDGQKLENSMVVYTLNRLLENTPPPPPQYSGGPKKVNTPSNPKASKPIAPKKVRGTVYEAEKAKIGGPGRASGNGGFSGTGYLDFGNGKQSVEWTVDAKTAAEHTLVFRYALAGGGRPLKLQVNGKTVVESVPK